MGEFNMRLNGLQQQVVHQQNVFAQAQVQQAASQPAQVPVASNKYMFLPKVGNKFNGSLFDVVTGSAIHSVSYDQGLPGDRPWYQSAIAQGLPDNSCQFN